MLIKVPASWPAPAVAVLAALTLAGLDLVGALAAKEAVLRRSVPIAVAGLGLFAVLFWVYASSLRYSDMVPVTFGWIVLLEIGVVLLERFRYGAALSPGQWSAVVVLVLAQAYLMFSGAGAD